MKNISKSNFIVRGGADFSSIQKEMAKTQASVAGFQTKISGSFSKLGKMITVALAGIGIGKFIKDSISEASKMESALVGLNSIANGTGRSFSHVQSFIDEFTQDGLIPAIDAITSYKNLLSRGYDDSQIQGVMNRLKDAAAFGRQSSYSYGEAISSATEGLKNENSMLVDNAGVTKNVAKMWDDYAKSIGTTSNKLTHQQKIAAEVAGIMEETKFQIGDSGRYADTYAGQTARLSKSFIDLKQAVGGIFMPIAQIVIPYISLAIQWITKLANTIAALVQSVTGKGGFMSVGSNTSNVSDGFSGVGQAAEDAGDSVAKGAKKAKGALMGFDEINNIQLPDSSGSDSSGGGVGGAGSADMPNISGLTDGFKVDDPFDKFGEGLKKFQEWYKGSGLKMIMDEIINFVKWILDNPITDFGNWISSGAIDLLKNLDDVLKSLAPVLGTFLGVFKNFYTKVLKPIAAWVVNEVLPTFFKQLEKIFNALEPYLEPIARAFDELFTALQPLGAWAGDTFIWFLERLGDIFAKIAGWGAQALIISLEGLTEIVKTITPYLSSVTDGLQRLYDAFLPLFELTGDTFVWLIEQIWEVLNKLAGWSAEIFVASLNLFASVLEAIEPILTPITNGLKWLWEEALFPLLSWTGDIAVGALVAVMDSISESLKKFGDWASENSTKIELVLSIIAGGLAGIAALKMAGVITGIATSMIGFIKNLDIAAISQGALNLIMNANPIALVVTALAALTGALIYLYNNNENVKAAMDGFWNNVLVPLGNFLKTVFTVAVDVLGKAFKSLKDNCLMPVYNFIKGTFAPYIEMLKGIFSGLTEFLDGVFSGDWKKAWNGIVEIFKSIFSGISSIAKGIINGLIGLVNGMIKGVIGGVNFVIDSINSLKIDIPDWIPGIGGESFGFSLARVDAPLIPKLAKGGIVDRPTLAMIGEAGKEAVMPLENNTGWMVELANMIGSIVSNNANSGYQNNSGGTGQAVFNIDGRQIAEATFDSFAAVANRRGVNLSPRVVT